MEKILGDDLYKNLRKSNLQTDHIYDFMHDTSNCKAFFYYKLNLTYDQIKLIVIT